MQLAVAINEWRQILGEESVRLDQSELLTRQKSTTPFATHQALCVLKPKSTEDVSRCMQIAYKYSIAVYPISTGHNWGFGEATPPTANQVLLDLSQMRQICEVNECLSYATIQPGVTQGQLQSHLSSNKINLWLDCTGAGPETSIVGNLCERGYGHLPIADRFQNSCNYELVLADGTIVSTGFGQYEDAASKDVFKTGIGPSLDGIFTQSNFAIITKATIWLLPKPESFAALAFALRRGQDLWPALAVTKRLVEQGVLRSYIHFGNDLRVLSSRTRFPYESMRDGVLSAAYREKMRDQHHVASWSAMGGFYGTKQLVKASIKEFRKALSPYGKVVVLGERKVSLASWLFHRFKFLRRFEVYKQFSQALPVFHLLKGIPDETHLYAARWRNRSGVDARGLPHLEGTGLVWHSPVVPLDEKSVNEATAIIQRVILDHGLDPMISMIIMTSRSMCMPTSIYFDKQSQQECARAARCYHALIAALNAAGYYSYRAGLQSMEKLENHRNQYWQMVHSLKNALDERNIIAPGRYTPKVSKTA